MSRDILGFAGRVTLSVGLLAILAFVVAEPRELARAIGRMHPAALVLAIGLAAADRCLMAYKWRLLLLARSVPIPLSTTIRAYFATTFAGLFLPITIGADVIRLMVVRQFGVHDVTASIIIERTIGVVAMGVLALVSCWVLAIHATGLRVAPLTATVLTLVAVGALALVLSFPLARWWATDHAVSPLARLAQAYEAYQSHPAVLATFFGLSLAESCLPVLLNYVVARGLGLNLPFFVFAATVPLALTVARLPISLGGFGVQEASFVYLAGLLGVPRTDALATVLVAGGVLVITVLPSAFDTSMLDLRQRRPARAGR